jgi:gas vesicle protein
MHIANFYSMLHSQEGPMDDSEYRDALSFITGLTVGALIGTAAALLFAPQSGRRTRRQIARTAEDLAGSAADTLDDVREDARDLADKAARETRRLARRARRGADRTGERIVEAVDQGRERLRH